MSSTVVPKAIAADDDFAWLFGDLMSDAEEDLPPASVPPAGEPPVKCRRLTGKQRPSALDLALDETLSIQETAIDEEPGCRKKRRAFPNETCEGRGMFEPCIFSTTEAGGRARVQKDRGETQCCFCDDEHLRTLADKPSGMLTTVLRRIAANNPDSLEKAYEHIARALGRAKEEKLRRTLATRPSRAKAKAKPGPKQVRQQRLEQRRWHGAAPAAEEAELHQKKVRDDERRLKKKFPGVFSKDAEDEHADDWMPEKAKGFKHWCQANSWYMCSKCHRLSTRKLEPMDIKQKDRKIPGTKQCNHCAHGVGYACPQPDEVPASLRGLSKAALLALRPFEVDSGHPPGKDIRATSGYRVHVDVIRFRWEKYSVKSRIKKLDEPDRQKAKDALQYLGDSEASNSYKKFHDMHKSFLEEHGKNAAKEHRRLPVNFMERVGIECAAWPHLYWTTGMCETFVRSEDIRCKTRSASAHGGPEDRDRSAKTIFAKAEAKRQAAKKRPASKKKATKKDDDDGSSSSDEEAADDSNDDPEGASRQSLKASFLAKVFSPVLGYNKRSGACAVRLRPVDVVQAGGRQECIWGAVAFGLGWELLLPGILEDLAFRPPRHAEAARLPDALPDHCSLRVVLPVPRVHGRRDEEAFVGKIAHGRP